MLNTRANAASDLIIWFARGKNKQIAASQNKVSCRRDYRCVRSLCIGAAVFILHTSSNTLQRADQLQSLMFTGVNTARCHQRNSRFMARLLLGMRGSVFKVGDRSWSDFGLLRCTSLDRGSEGVHEHHHKLYQSRSAGNASGGAGWILVSSFGADFLPKWNESVSLWP